MDIVMPMKMTNCGGVLLKNTMIQYVMETAKLELIITACTSAKNNINVILDRDTEILNSEMAPRARTCRASGARRARTALARDLSEACAQLARPDLARARKIRAARVKTTAKNRKTKNRSGTKGGHQKRI
ncbi:hypothetical protein Ddc_23242 [Ditylenchus destructor]|nr:hypothetical protein Ddc_23242 [Ditylenchus destructor]